MWGKKRQEEVKQALQAIVFEEVSGRPMEQPLTLFALSTCGFCRRAITFLNDQGYAYRFVHMDRLPREQQDSIRTYIKQTFKVAISFPFLCLGEQDFITGFLRASWEKELEEACDEQRTTH